MTVSSHSHTLSTGAGVGTRAPRDEAAVLFVAGHLTDRDRELVRLVARHRVLTTDQLAALAFGNITTARHRLAVLVRLGLLRRFRPHLQTGSAPWHYVLGPIGAALLGQEHTHFMQMPPIPADSRRLPPTPADSPAFTTIRGHITASSAWRESALLATRFTDHNGGYARALKSRRQLRYVIRLSALLAELCRIVHR